jgi:hypothetical protein
MLQFFYNVHGDLTLSPIRRMTKEIEEKHLYLPIKVHTLADKYDAGPLRRWAVSTLKDNLAKCEDVDYILEDEVCFRMVRVQYDIHTSTGTEVGNTIGAYVARKKRPVINQRDGADLIHEYPAFGADILLALAPDLWKLR